jgi:hypothetical protein
MEKTSEAEIYNRILKSLSSTKEDFITVSYSDVSSDELAYEKALDKMKNEGYMIDITDEYFGTHLTRGETIYKANIYKKTKQTDKIFQDKINLKKKNLSDKIEQLSSELDSYRKELNALDYQELDIWFKKVCGNAYYVKFTESDSDWFGIFRVEEIDTESTYGFGYCYVLGTLINTYPTKKDFCGVNFKYKISKEQIKDERRITKTQFNKVLEKTRKMMV